jgi:hypothetical protein
MYKTECINVKFEVFTAVTMKITVVGYDAVLKANKLEEIAEYSSEVYLRTGLLLK